MCACPDWFSKTKQASPLHAKNDGVQNVTKHLHDGGGSALACAPDAVVSDLGL